MDHLVELNKLCRKNSEKRLLIHNGYCAWGYGSPNDPVFINSEDALKIIEILKNLYLFVPSDIINQLEKGFPSIQYTEEPELLYKETFNRMFIDFMKPEDCGYSNDDKKDVWKKIELSEATMKRSIDLSRINEVKYFGEYLLLAAIKNGFIDSIYRLLENGADPLVTDEKGNNALHCVVRSELPEEEIINLIEVFIIKYKVDPNSKNYQQYTVLAEASMGMNLFFRNSRQESIRQKVKSLGGRYP